GGEPPLCGRVPGAYRRMEDPEYAWHHVGTHKTAERNSTHTGRQWRKPAAARTADTKGSGKNDSCRQRCGTGLPAEIRSTCFVIILKIKPVPGIYFKSS